MTIDIAILLSVGLHPLSGRPRRAELDARAVELALRLAAGQEGARLHAVHAGNPKEASLRDYLGMGLDRLTVLELAEEADPLPPLILHLTALKPAITLAGLQSEGGEASGFLPYALAEALGLTLAPAIADLAWEGEGVRLEQALRGGRRRALFCPIPVVATIDKAAPVPRQSAYGKARRDRDAAGGGCGRSLARPLARGPVTASRSSRRRHGQRRRAPRRPHRRAGSRGTKAVARDARGGGESDRKLSPRERIARGRCRIDGVPAAPRAVAGGSLS
jgi:electron transfer flavoprotein beta subunit